MDGWRMDKNGGWCDHPCLAGRHDASSCETAKADEEAEAEGGNGKA
jgi:hypothetical protein